MLNRHQIREKIVFALYQHLLLEKDLDECFLNNFADEVDDFSICIKEDIKKNEDNYINQISRYLVDWTFIRLNYVDQAILLEALSEIRLKLNENAIVIDEAVRLSKTYSDETAYRYINGVLDKL